MPLPSPSPIVSDIRPSDHAELDMADVRSSLRSAMWRNVGIERVGQALQSLLVVGPVHDHERVPLHDLDPAG